MPNSPTTLAEQIAALETTLKLPLPEPTRAQLQQELDRLRAQHDAGAIHGTADVSGTLYGNAIGVNLGTVQNYLGGAPPGTAPGQPNRQATTEQIADQRELLAAHRRTLAIYLKQLAQLGSAHAPPSVHSGIREARIAIRQAKAALRGWGAAVEEYPDDEERSDV